MFRADAVVVESPGLRRGALHGGAGILCQTLAGHARRAQPAAAHHQTAQPLPVQPLPAEDVRAQPVLLRQDAEQQMLGAHIAVAQVARRGPGLFNGLLSPLGKLLIAFDGTSLLTVGSSWLRLSSETAAERGETRRDGKSITKRFTKYMQNQRF